MFEIDNTPMQSAAITLSDLPDLRFPKSSLRISEDSTHLEAMTMRGMETKNAVLTLEAGEREAVYEGEQPQTAGGERVRGGEAAA